MSRALALPLFVSAARCRPCNLHDAVHRPTIIPNPRPLFKLSRCCAVLLIRCTSYPRRIVIVYAGYILSLLFLFAQFYVNSYSKPKPSKKTA